MPIYEKPAIRTMDAAGLIESMGPAQGYMVGQQVDQAMPQLTEGVSRR